MIDESLFAQMVDSNSGVVVTEEMIIAAADDGDLESLRKWARQGVQVKTWKPMWAAVAGEYREVLEVLTILVQELGADVNQAVHARTPPLIMAAGDGDLAMVRCLVELGASIDTTDTFGDTALLKSV
jgi:ankyrin repeat protein